MSQQLKKVIFIFSLFALVLGQVSFLIPNESLAAINERINYQGKLTDSSGVAVTDGDYRMKFNLYTVETGGSSIWAEDRSASPGDQVTVSSGLFSVMLGSSTALSGVNFNQTLYLGVEICGLGSGAESCDGEMTPRKMIGAVPAAFEAGKLSGLNSSQFLRSDAENSTSTASAFLRITQTGAGNIADFTGQGSASVLSVLSSGNVGVGTSSPYARFSVAGQTVSEYFTATSTTATSTLPLLAVTGGLSTALSENSIAFIGAGGMLVEDNSDFTYSPSVGLRVSATNDVYSLFGASSAKLNPNNNIDRLISTKEVTDIAGTRRAFASIVQFSGTSDHSGELLGFQSIAYQNSASAALTKTTGAGGLSGGRVGISIGNNFSNPMGNISLATGLSIYNERNITALQSASITELIGVQIEGTVLDDTTITDYSGFRMKEPSGTPLTITNLYGIRIDEMDVATNNWAIYTAGNTKSYFGGNVGIGTTTPYSKLSVWGASTGSARIFELVNSASTTLFSVAADGTTNIGAASAGNIVFDTSTSGDIVLVGIGTTTPDADVSIVSDRVESNTYLFTVATTTGDVINRKFTIDSDGDIAYDGTASTPADYAEAFGVVGQKENYEPGDIVVTSKNSAGRVEKSDKPYQSNIAGVYSTKPGILGVLREDVTSYQIENENDIPVGIMGRVPTKVSTENGPIEVGDYITSSSQSGVGMKATNAGKVVGVALESFDEVGVGRIMVFLNDTFYFGEEGFDLASRISNLEIFLQTGDFNGNQSPFQKLFELIGVKIKDGLAFFTRIVTERLQVGSAEKPSGITLFDEKTGEPYCISVNKGKITTQEGECKIKETEIDSGNLGGGGGGGSVEQDEETSVPPPTVEGDEGGVDQEGDSSSEENQDGDTSQDEGNESELEDSENSEEDLIKEDDEVLEEDEVVEEEESNDESSDQDQGDQDSGQEEPPEDSGSE